MTNVELIKAVRERLVPNQPNHRAWIIAGDDLDLLYTYAMKWAEIQDFRIKLEEKRWAEWEKPV